MPSISMTISHKLQRQEAIQRLESRFGDLQETYGSQIGDFKENWDGEILKFGFTTFNLNISGSVEVDTSEVRLFVELPLAAMMFKEMIQKQIGDELQKLLS